MSLDSRDLELIVEFFFSDKKIRLFSRDPARQASGAALETYEAELASFQMSFGTLGEMDSQKLPGVEALTVPGKAPHPCRHPIRIPEVLHIQTGSLGCSRGACSWSGLTGSGVMMDAI